MSNNSKNEEKGRQLGSMNVVHCMKTTRICRRSDLADVTNEVTNEGKILFVPIKRTIYLAENCYMRFVLPLSSPFRPTFCT